MRWPHGPARAALDAYAAAPRGDRFHVWGRALSCPFATVERAVPVVGDVLEVGCGHGLLSCYLALAAAGRRVVGVDIDGDKIALARAAAARLPPASRPSFERTEPDELPPGSFDAVVIADVLYLLPDADREALLGAAADLVAPDGVLVVKETALTPRWKARLTRAQELLSTGVLGITEGETVAFPDPAVDAGRLRAAGFAVTTERVDAGYLHPHHLLVARRPGGRGSDGAG